MADDITQVHIGKNLIGLRGLTEIFEELASRSWESPAAAQEEVLRRAAGANYIPSGSRDDYGRALWREFRRFKGEAAEAEAARRPGDQGPGAGLLRLPAVLSASGGYPGGPGHYRRPAVHHRPGFA